MSRRRDPTATRPIKGRYIPTRRRRALARKRRKKLMQGFAVCLLVPVAAAALLASLRGDGGPKLPDELGPEAFAPHAEFRSTDRVGTMLKATLKLPPLDADPGAFEADMRAVAARAQAAGYETVVIVAPDGTTLAAGSVEDPAVQLPDHEGT